VREDRVEHRADRVGIVDSHPLPHQAVEKILIVEDAPAAVRVRRHHSHRFEDREVEVGAHISLSCATIDL